MGKVMTNEELAATNRAYLLPISERSNISIAFSYLRTQAQGFHMGYLIASQEWDFEGDTATRKSDGFTISRDEIDRSEVWT